MVKLITQFNYLEIWKFNYLIERQGVLFRFDPDNKDHPRGQTAYREAEMRESLGAFLTKFELELEYD